VGQLSLPPAYLEEMTFEELGWLLENHQEQEKERYELLAHVISVGYARTQTKKKIQLFSEQSNSQSGFKLITKEEKEQGLSRLSELFAK